MKKILLSSFVAVLLLTGCGEDKKAAETKVVEENKTTTVVEKVEPKVEEKTAETKLVEQVKESASQVASTIAEESKKVVEVGGEAVKSVSEKVVTKTQEVTKEVAKVASETQEKIEASMEDIVATKTDDSDKGKGLFLKCAGCHGQNAEKAALGKSAIVKGWSKDKIVSALKGYKDGTYGGVMKGVMKSQVMNLSDEEIDALGAYIASF